MGKSVIRYIEKLLNGNRNVNFIEVSDNMIINNIFSIPPYGEFIIKDSNWNVSSNRSVLRLIHGNTFIGDLIKSYVTTKDTKYIDYAYCIVKDWVESHLEINSDDKVIYHDETTALRLNYWISLYRVSENIVNLEDRVFLINEMNKLAKLLSEESFYAGNNNHGMFQDLSLLIYSLLIEDDDSLKYRELSEVRLLEYFNSCFTEEGVHKEQTPSYHYLISNKIKSLLDLFESIDKEKYKILYELYKKTELFATYIIKPDGKIPQIGDNSCDNIGYKTYKKLYDSDEYNYSISVGEEGIYPKNNNIVFKDSGYAIFRDDWNKKTKGYYLLFTAAYNSNYHKHCDDLSLLIYKDGDIISEAGPNGYNYSDEFTQYAYSSFAHNSLVINNKSLPRIDNKFDCVGIEEYLITESESKVRGYNYRDDKVKHTRELIYDNKYKVVINDVVKSDTSNKLSFYWNLASNVNCYILGKSGYLFRNGNWIGKINIDSNIDFSINLYCGEKYKNKLGWNFPEMGSKVKNSVLEINMETDTMELVTEIILFEKEKTIKEFKETVSYVSDYEVTQYIENNELVAEVNTCDTIENAQFAYYVYYENDVIFKSLYSDDKCFKYKLDKKGFYYIRIFAKIDGKVIAKSPKNKVLFGEEQREGLTFYYEEGDSNPENLVVVFSAMNEKHSFRYSYFNLIRDYKECNKLFILDDFDIQGAYYLGKNRKFSIQDKVNNLIEKIIKDNNLNNKKVILCGSSKGAYAALYTTIKYNYPYCIAGAPQYNLGNFLISEAKHIEIAEYISGGTSDECREYLNNIMKNMIISRNKIKSKIYIHISKNEYHYRKHFIDLEKILKEKKVNLGIDLDTYENHNDLKEYFPEYLIKTISKIIN